MLRVSGFKRGIILRNLPLSRDSTSVTSPNTLANLGIKWFVETC